MAHNKARRAMAPTEDAMTASTTTKSLDPKAMEARVARFNKLQTYQTQNLAVQGIPPGAMEKITARKVYPVMAPADYQGRSAGAPVKGPRGLIVTIAECEPGNGPGLHRHLNTVENFMCLSGLFEIAWGDQGEHTLVLDPLDMISVPRGENRSFRNVSKETGRLLVMIVPETAEQADPISYAPSLAREIETEYGKDALEGLRKVGFKFEEPVS
jgi:mannose-6-phosphate isomerase-like protein (cupin superfamily)